jgi:hypothetical protein
MTNLQPLGRLDTFWGEEIATSWLEIGPLALPSGAVVAGDPFTLLSDDVEPFAPTIEPGGYPVRLVLGHYFVPKDPEQTEAVMVEDLRVGLAVLCLGDGVPVRWENAMPAGVGPLPEDEIWCYLVDSGSGAFIDAATLPLLHQRYQDDSDFVQHLVDAIQAHYQPTYNWADVVLDAETGANMLTFATYGGDSQPASYWGIAADGQRICLVTDFDAFDLEAWQALEGRWFDLLEGRRGNLH